MDPSRMTREQRLDRYVAIEVALERNRRERDDLNRERLDLRKLLLPQALAASQAPKSERLLPEGRGVEVAMQHLQTGPTTSGDIAAALGVKQSSVRMALVRARGMGLCDLRPDGKWEARVYKQNEGPMKIRFPEEYKPAF